MIAASFWRILEEAPTQELWTWRTSRMAESMYSRWSIVVSRWALVVLRICWRLSIVLSRKGIALSWDSRMSLTRVSFRSRSRCRTGGILRGDSGAAVAGSRSPWWKVDRRLTFLGWWSLTISAWSWKLEGGCTDPYKKSVGCVVRPNIEGAYFVDNSRQFDFLKFSFRGWWRAQGCRWFIGRRALWWW